MSVAGACGADERLLSSLAREHGTPFYLYDLDAAAEHVRALRAALPAAVELLYAVKANPNRRVVASMRGQVGGLDISSGGEIDIATAAGFPPAAMSFAGPGKTDAEIEQALRAGVGLLSIESPGELLRTAEAARAMGKRAAIALRINPAAIPKEFPMKMGGGPSQFGIAEEHADEAVALAKATPHLDLRGFHVFSGTNCLDEAAIVENVEGTLRIARSLSERHDLAPRVVNLGGGFGIPYFAGQEPMQVAALGHGVGGAVERLRRGDARFAETRFLLELGRYLIGPFGTYVARVVDVKATRGKRFVILDGGMNHCFPATGNFGQVIKKNYPVQNVSRPVGAPPSPQELVGPLCTPIDSMGRAVQMPAAEVGDLIAFLSCGAYSFTASPILFLSHPTPPELVLSGGAVEVARPRQAAGTH